MKADRIVVLCGLALSFVLAAKVFSEEPSPMASRMPSAMSTMGGPQAQPSPGASVDQMAKAMTSMAQVCQLMMQREMRRSAAMRPLTMGLGGLIVILLVLALSALVVLEIQSIRLTGIRIRNERVGPPRS
jgi:predicted nucleic acid-binding Zn ribbon protein